MDIKEKLRLAALQAENELLERIPADSEIDWTPSEDFNKKMDEIIGEKPKRGKLIIRRLFIAAAVIALLSTLLVPVFKRDSEVRPNNTNGVYGGPEDEIPIEIDPSFFGGSETENVVPDVPSGFEYSPSYLPKGYELTNSTANEYCFTLEYSNGSDVIRLYYYEGETDFSELDDRKGDLDENGYYNRVPETLSVEKDPSADAIFEYAFFPDEVEWNRNNVAWNNNGKTFAIMGSENLSQKELEKIAASVNSEPKE